MVFLIHTDIQEKFSIYHLLCATFRMNIFRDASSQMRNINSTMQSPCCISYKNINIARYLKFFQRSKTPKSAYSVSPPVCHLRIPRGCAHIINNRASGNTNVECLISLGRASSVLSIDVCNYTETLSLTVHYSHALLRD